MLLILWELQRLKHSSFQSCMRLLCKAHAEQIFRFLFFMRLTFDFGKLYYCIEQPLERGYNMIKRIFTAVVLTAGLGLCAMAPAPPPPHHHHKPVHRPAPPPKQHHRPAPLTPPPPKHHPAVKPAPARRPAAPARPAPRPARPMPGHRR